MALATRMTLADLAALLRCPACGGAYAAESGALRCAAAGCGAAVVPAPDDAPRFAGDAQVDAGFDLRWALHRAHQATSDHFWDRVGWAPGDLRGKRVLDAGCGVGRFAKRVAEAGAAAVVGLDVSPAALATARELVPGPAGFVQADLLAPLPFAPASFDAVYSVGVLHHTADPARAFANLARVVKPGGRIAVWVYVCPVPDPRWLAATEMLHAITRACPPAALHAACARYAAPLAALYKTGDPRLTALTYVLQVSGSPDADERVSDTFDWHTPQHRSWHTADEVKGWFAANGCTVTRVGGFPVSVGGYRREAAA